MWQSTGVVIFLLHVFCVAEGAEAERAAEFYDAYHKQRGSTTSGAHITWDRVKELYPADVYGSILDAGAGNCALVRHILAEGDRVVRGAELSGEAVRRYCVDQEDIPSGVVVQAPIDSLPFKNDTFDLVISFEVLEHLPEEMAAVSIKELIRVSRKGELLLTISLRRAWQDPNPPEEAHIHVNVKPRAWWHNLMTSLGCALREDVIERGQRRAKHRATQVKMERKFSARPLHAPIQDGEFQVQEGMTLYSSAAKIGSRWWKAGSIGFGYSSTIASFSQSASQASVKMARK